MKDDFITNLVAYLFIMLCFVGTIYLVLIGVAMYQEDWEVKHPTIIERHN